MLLLVSLQVIGCPIRCAYRVCQIGSFVEVETRFLAQMIIRPSFTDGVTMINLSLVIRQVRVAVCCPIGVGAFVVVAILFVGETAPKLELNRIE